MSAGDADPRRSDARQNALRILTVAAQELRADPGASLETIIAATGLSRTTVYRHFSSRPRLVDAVVDRQLRALEEVMANARPTRGPFTDALDRMTHAVLGAVELHDAVAIASRDQLVSSPPALRITEVTERLMARGVRAGALRKDVGVAWHAEVYLTLLELAARDSASTPETVVRLLLDGFGA